MSPSSATPPTSSDAWIPKSAGDQLTGEVTDIDAAWSQFRANQAPNDPDAGWYPLLTIRQPDGTERKLHGFRTVLYNELLRKKPLVGETVTVTFVGEGRDPGKGMNAAHIYKVTVAGRGSSPTDAYSGLRPARGPGANAAAAGAPVDDGEEPLPF